jgi:hypothetical protein
MDWSCSWASSEWTEAGIVSGVSEFEGIEVNGFLGWWLMRLSVVRKEARREFDGGTKLAASLVSRVFGRTGNN